MGLSFCSNFGSLQHHNYPQLTPFQEIQTEMATELLGCQDHSFGLSDNFIYNPLFELDNELFYSDTYSNLLPYFSSPSDETVILSSEFFTLEFESSHPLKRQKSYEIPCQSSFLPNCFDGYIPYSNPVLPEFIPESTPASLPKFEPLSVAFNGGRNESAAKKPREGSLPAQSIAARERRKKITEKTQKLGKLIPGGNKMNTAEMFHAAAKFVKFLEAQVQVLHLMDSVQERKEPFHTQGLHSLLASPAIQEKLYSEEKCLVLRKFVQNLANDQKIQSQPLIIEEIEQLLETNQ